MGQYTDLTHFIFEIMQFLKLYWMIAQCLSVFVKIVIKFVLTAMAAERSQDQQIL